MIKIQTSNQNLPRVIHYLQRIFSIRLSCISLALSARVAHAPDFGQSLAATCPCRRPLNNVESIQHLSPPHHFSPTFNTPLKRSQVLNPTFNTPIALGLEGIRFLCQFVSEMHR